MIFIGNIRNKWARIIMSKTVVFSSMDKLLDDLINQWSKYESFDLDYFFTNKFYKISEIEMDVKNKPKTVSIKRIKKELETRPELLAKVLLSKNSI